MADNQVIAVWGSPSCGKTTLSIKMAVELSRKRMNTAIILCNPICPELPVILPFLKDKGKSLGALLAIGEITQEKILSSSVTVEKSDYISLLGYHLGENVFSHAAYTKEKTLDLIVLLRHVADYVIFDCSSILTSDVLSTTALEVADKVIRLSSCDLKGVSYFASYLPLLADRRFEALHHIKGLSNVKPMEPRNEIAHAMGTLDFELPHADEVLEQYLTGRLFEPLKSRQGKRFEKTVKTIVEGVLDE